MASSGYCLGICFADNRLFYAVKDPHQSGHLKYIGCVDFNFSIINALANSENENFRGLQRTVSRLQNTYSCGSVRMLSPAIYECWSIFPRLVYETPDEREDHLSILMGGIPRNEIEPTWFDLSNQDFKMLVTRNLTLSENYRILFSEFNQTDFVSEFELGMDWHFHSGMRGSYLIINCQPGHIAISSYLLGKLRGATFISHDTVNDLPYLWNYYGEHLGWINGIHEQFYLFGPLGIEVTEVMSSFFNKTGRIIVMHELKDMKVTATETTYGFKLESAFPAILLSLNLSDQEDHVFQ